MVSLWTNLTWKMQHMGNLITCTFFKILIVSYITHFIYTQQLDPLLLWLLHAPWMLLHVGTAAMYHSAKDTLVGTHVLLKHTCWFTAHHGECVPQLLPGFHRLHPGQRREPRLMSPDSFLFLTFRENHWNQIQYSFHSRYQPGSMQSKKLPAYITLAFEN